MVFTYLFKNNKNTFITLKKWKYTLINKTQHQGTLNGSTYKLLNLYEI